MKNNSGIVATKFLSATAIAFMIFLLNNCGSGSMMTNNTPPPPTQISSFVFVSNMGSNAISAFEVDSQTGSLFPIVVGPFSTGGGPEFMAVDASNKFLFVGNTTSNDISAFEIDGGTEPTL
jgi:hypothetical protein